MKIEVILNDTTIDIDNGYQYISIPLEDARYLLETLREKLTEKTLEENIKKDYKYFGGL